MARDDVVRRAKEELRAGEELLLLLPAIRPSDDRGGGITLAWLVPLKIVIDRWQHRRELRDSTRQSLFPLAPRMVVGLTSQRLLIWHARRRWRLGPFLGYVSLDRIIQAEAPTIGQGWRTVRVHLANEPTVKFKVPGKHADELAAELSKPAD